MLDRAKCFVHYGFVGSFVIAWLTISFTLTIICGRPRRKWQTLTQAHPYLAVVVLLLFPFTSSSFHFLSVLNLSSGTRKFCAVLVCINVDLRTAVHRQCLGTFWMWNPTYFTYIISCAVFSKDFSRVCQPGWLISPSSIQSDTSIFFFTAFSTAS
jgi:hypothetical protein